MLSLAPRVAAGRFRAPSARAITYGAPPPSSLAAWNTGAVNELVALSGTALSSVDPSPYPGGSGGYNGKTNAWNSSALDVATSRLYHIDQGGHTDYAGNEGDMLDLLASTPAWSQLLASSTGIPGTNNAPYYGDGRPASVHSYNGAEFDDPTARVILFGGSRYSDGQVRNVVDGYDVGSNAYLAAASYADMPDGTTGFGGSSSSTWTERKVFVKRTSTGDVYVFANFNIGRWNRSDGSWTMLHTGRLAPAGVSVDAAAAWDPVRDRAFILGGGYCATYDPAVGGSAGWVDRTPSGSTGVASTTMLGMDYEPVNDLFYVCDSSGDIYTVHPTTFAITALTPTGATMPACTNGPLKRWRYVPSQQGFVCVPNHTANVHFLRTH